MLDGAQAGDRLRRHRRARRCCRSTATSRRRSSSRPTAAPTISLSSPAHDDDPFARYEAMQQLMLDTLLARDRRPARTGHEPVIEAVPRDARPIRRSIRPSSPRRCWCRPRAFIGDQMTEVDPEAIHAAREALRGAIWAASSEPLWRDAYAATAANRFELSPAAKGARRLRTVALGYLMAARRRRRAGAGAAPVRRGRQHDRPAGRARRARQRRRAGARGRARRLLRALPGQRAGHRQMVHHPGARRRATTRCRRSMRLAAPSRFHA